MSEDTVTDGWGKVYRYKAPRTRGLSAAAAATATAQAEARRNGSIRYRKGAESVSVGECPTCKKRFFLTEERRKEAIVAKVSPTDPGVYPLVCRRCA